MKGDDCAVTPSPITNYSSLEMIPVGWTNTPVCASLLIQIEMPWSSEKLTTCKDV